MFKQILPDVIPRLLLGASILDFDRKRLNATCLTKAASVGDTAYVTQMQGKMTMTKQTDQTNCKKRSQQMICDDSELFRMFRRQGAAFL